MKTPPNLPNRTYQKNEGAGLEHVSTNLRLLLKTWSIFRESTSEIPRGGPFSSPAKTEVKDPQLPSLEARRLCRGFHPSVARIPGSLPSRFGNSWGIFSVIF